MAHTPTPMASGAAIRSRARIKPKTENAIANTGNIKNAPLVPLNKPASIPT